MLEKAFSEDVAVYTQLFGIYSLVKKKKKKTKMS